MADIGTLIDFTDGNVLYAAQLDSNFGDIRTVVNSAVVHTDKASQTITKTITYTPDAGAAIGQVARRRRWLKSQHQVPLSPASQPNPVRRPKRSQQ